MAKSHAELVREEQASLDDTIRAMDNTLLKLNKTLTVKKLQADKAKTACLPDTYGMLVSAEHDKIQVREKMKNIDTGKKELYETRLVLDIKDSDGYDREEIKIGLHTYLSGEQVFIMSWKMPLCRHYILDNSAKEYKGVVTGKHGEKYETHYNLRLKRKVAMLFDKIQTVMHLYPDTGEEIEKIIADEFLQELLNRRSGEKLKNIVFSIQQKQGEIIQTRFKQNLIVQGCAGSGKSMIMLHRLPIIIYDNPNSLDRNNLYIITPSTAYIQMADEMRIDLEIDDLNMGTLEQYYEHVLKKYDVTPEVYGIRMPDMKLKQEQMEYVYSAECVKDIKTQIEEITEESDVDYKTAYAMLNLEEEIRRRKISTPYDRIFETIVKIQKVINQNDESLKNYHQSTFDLLEQLKEFARQLNNRKIAILRGVARVKEKSEKLMKEKEKEISKITDFDEHSVKYQNHVAFIQAAKSKIAEMENVEREVEAQDQYFKLLKEKAKQIRQFLKVFDAVKKDRSKMSLDEQYQSISNRGLLSIRCKRILEDVALLEDLYKDYTISIESGIHKLEKVLERFDGCKEPYLPQDYLKELKDAVAHNTKISKESANTVYISIMKKLGAVLNEKKELVALECSPYLYLQILYQFYGKPKATRESLITIDEAQNIAPEELRLIRAVNGKKVVLNLFGDVKQHIEGTKGIDDWKMISNIAGFKKENMQENYRNAKQITEYCNKRFKLNMRAINLDGSGVHELKDESELDKVFAKEFQKSKKAELRAIIIKNKEEADTVLAKAGSYTSKIHNMLEGKGEIEAKKWNLLTVEQSRGLEFKKVIAVTGRMSENEKYITYTRALDELYVYDEKL